MRRGILPIIFAIAVNAMPARAADLPEQSRLGAVFAEPRQSHRSNSATTRVTEETEGPAFFGFAPEVEVQSKVNGYYGKNNSYYYAPYYGSKYNDYAWRLPYACGFFGYC